MKVYELLELCNNNLTYFQFEDFSSCKYLGLFSFSELKNDCFYFCEVVKFHISYSYEYGYTIWIYI